MSDESEVITFALTEDEALALAQFCKRQTWQMLHEASGGPREHDEMQSAFFKLRRALREKGWAPR